MSAARAWEAIANCAATGEEFCEGMETNEQTALVPVWALKAAMHENNELHTKLANIEAWSESALTAGLGPEADTAIEQINGEARLDTPATAIP